MKKTLYYVVALVLSSTFCYAQITFEPKITIDPDTGDNPLAIASGFIDADAFIDVILGTDVDNTLIWYKNNGDNTFTAQTAITNEFSAIGVIKLVDLNNDTYLDVVVTAYSSDSVTWYANDGLGNFGAEQTIVTIGGASGLFIGDVDGNMTPDIVTTAYDDDQVLWFSNDGDGNFSTPASSVIDPMINAPSSVHMKDIDNDGDLDALVATTAYSNDRLEIYRNDLVPGGIVSFTKDASPVTEGKLGLFSAEFTDLDGDANLDIIATEVSFGGAPSGNLYWYEDNGSGFTETAFTTSINNPSLAQVEDLDGDDIKDIILSNGQGEPLEPGNTDLSWFKNNGDGTFGSENIIDTSQSQVFFYAISDFDNDTDLDIMSASYNQDTLNYFINTYITLNIDDTTLEKVSIYPNPANSVINFKGLLSDKTIISVTDMLGRNVLTKSINMNESLDVSQLVSGVYSITIDGTFASKFIKE